MIIKKPNKAHPKENDITSEKAYLSRRKFILGAGAVAGAGLLGAQSFLGGDRPEAAAIPPSDLAAKKTDFGAGLTLTDEAAVTGFNNFYEFGVSKGDPVRYAGGMETTPWSITVDGAVDKPGTYALEDLIDFNALEERIYRLRCVEAWSMVIPWIGVSLASVLKKVGPTSKAKYVAFQTKLDKTMFGTRYPVLDWPYQEGLRIDEAMNDLTLLSVGLFGKVLPNQNGAPVRLVVPWKYGFKSIKSITRISLVEQQPATSWNVSAPREYGFYSNVNPNVNHPRWAQDNERIIGELFRRRPTDMFNGYAEEVGQMYAGMDLKANY